MPKATHSAYERNKALRIRLERWGAWRRLGVPGLGFAGSSPLQRLAETGVSAADSDALGFSRGPDHSSRGYVKGTTSYYAPHPEESEVDREVAAMPAIWQRVVKLRFEDERCRTDDERAAVANVSRARWYTLLNEAMIHLAAKLDYPYEP